MPGMLDRWLMATLAAAVLGLAACGDTAEVRTVTVTAPAAEPSGAEPSAVDGDAILIRTRITDAAKHEGAVLDGSFIGDSTFCPGGTTRGGGQVPVITTINCPDGRLRIKFAPAHRGESTLGAVWEVVSDTGRFEGLRGGGSMAARFDSNDPDIGQETFIGAVGR